MQSKILQRIALCAVVIFFTIGTAPKAFAEERITRFESILQVHPDASLETTELIEVKAEGQSIRRGIFRDIPTRYRDRHGLNFHIAVDVLSVERDGRPEPFALEQISGGQRIRIGDANVFLDHGTHRYKISYRSTRQIGFFENYDELYWNVTGNGWLFPIDQASVTLHLPQQAKILSSAAYTGPKGAGGKDFTERQKDQNIYRAETTKRLERAEGFTIAVSWPKGFVVAPTEMEKNLNAVRDNAGLSTLFAGILVVLAYFYFAWRRVGRDPEQGQIIPLFEPPSSIGPSAARYIREQSFDDRTFAAALVSLASTGHISINNQNYSFEITNKNNTHTQAAAIPEQALLQKLPYGSLELKNKNHLTISRLKSTLREALKKQYDGSVFSRNMPWFFLGAGLTLIIFVLTIFFAKSENAFVGIFMAIFSTFWWAATLTAIHKNINKLRAARGVFRSLFALILVGFSSVFIIGGFIPLFVLFAENQFAESLQTYGAAMILVVINYLFFTWLRAYTPSGAKLKEQIEGFRLYLATAEEGRLNALHPPEKTPELFERYLPYALALDCENEWSNQFAAVLAAAAVAGAATPAWYSGHGWENGDASTFVNELGSSLASTLGSAASAPGSSGGGSFGGGSSGGGGGGGGGGGW